MKLDYKLWQTKEELKAFVEENEMAEASMPDKMAKNSKTNVALMSLISFFALSKLFQIQKRMEESGERKSDLATASRFENHGESVDDDEAKPGSTLR